MGIARHQLEKPTKREPGFVRKLLATFSVRAKHLTKNWTPMFMLTVGLTVATLGIELTDTTVPIYWYVLVLLVAAGTVAQEIIYSLKHGT